MSTYRVPFHPELRLSDDRINRLSVNGPARMMGIEDENAQGNHRQNDGGCPNNEASDFSLLATNLAVQPEVVLHIELQKRSPPV